MTDLRVVLVALWAAACGGGRATSGFDTTGDPPEIRRACDLMVVRCTRCHSIDRVAHPPSNDADHWIHYVQRMKNQPGSGISQDDAGVILECLLHHADPADPGGT